jgi:hypothetical protein
MIGHILRHDSLTRNVIEGDVEGYIGRGRLRMEYMKQIMIDTGKDNYKELKELSYNRKAWRNSANQFNDRRPKEEDIYLKILILHLIFRCKAFTLFNLKFNFVLFLNDILTLYYILTYFYF